MSLALLQHTKIKSWQIASLSAIFVLFSALLSFLVLQGNANATLDGFSAGNIMGDEVMSNKGAMTESQIQSFLKSKNSCNDTNLSRLTSYNSTQGYIKSGSKIWYYNLKNGHFVCMADESFNGESAAHIIWQAAQDYSINPQVIIVLLEKEQSLVTDTWPNTNIQYAAATGYDCPDNGNGCNNANAGFKTQVRKAAALFHDVLSGGWSNYPVGNNYIQYNPSASCGGSTVNIQNRATSALYRYTPYQPNKAALAAGWGTAPCGAYGNRNFYNLFTSWFGSTRYTVKGGIGALYNQLGASTSYLGNPTQNERCGLVNSGCYQAFQGGSIYWTQSTGAHAIHGAVRTQWASTKYETGVLGYPTSEETGVTGGVYQQFQYGRIYWSSVSGAWYTHGAINDAYTKAGGAMSTAGYPVSNERGGLRDKGFHQIFQKASIYWSPASGAHIIKNGIRDKWASFGYENSTLAYPIDEETCGLQNNTCVQHFQGGNIYWSSTLGSIQTWGGINSRYKSLGANSGQLGFPKTPESCTLKGGGCVQQFDNGNIVWSSSTGAWESINGPIRTYWINIAGVDGPLGYPISSQSCNLKDGGCYQAYEGGRLYWSSTTNTKYVHGAILNKYLSLKAENGSLGYPITDETYANGTTSQKFEHGTIYWTNKKGAWI